MRIGELRIQLQCAFIGQGSALKILETVV
jgi:hypothetical protein